MIKLVEPKPNQDLIELLEELYTLAVTGELTGVAAVLVYQGGETDHCHTDVYPRPVIGEMSYLVDSLKGVE